MRMFAIAILLPSIVLLTDPATAFAGCNPRRTNDGAGYFAGWNSPAEPGVTTVNSALIYNYANPYVYRGSGVFAWVMLNGPGSDFAQIGWNADSGGRHTFSEWSTNGQVGSNFSIVGDPPGSTSWYEVYWDSGSSNFSYCFALNGTNVGCSGNLGWDGNYGEDDAEIHSLADQMPGGVHAPEDWNNSFIFYDFGQHNFAGYGVDYNTRYFNDAVYSQIHAQEDDKACNA
jgi:hypothetical protein